MELDQLKDILNKAEIVEVLGGHMGTSRYYLVIKYEGETFLKLELGNDGFNDGDSVGFQFGWNRRVEHERDI